MLQDILILTKKCLIYMTNKKFEEKFYYFFIKIFINIIKIKYHSFLKFVNNLESIF